MPTVLALIKRAGLDQSIERLGVRRREPRPAAPYYKKHSEAKDHASWLKSYARSLVRYHLHPETKFQGGEYDQRGPLKRRHVFALAQQSIGKEADNIEENEFIGEDAGPPDYGVVRHEPSTTTSTFSATSYPEARSASFERRRSGRGKPRPLRDRNRTSKTSCHSIRLVVTTPSQHPSVPGSKPASLQSARIFDTLRREVASS